VTTWDEYIREMEQDLAERRTSLEPLKSGQMRLGLKLFWSDCVLNVKLRANIA
jgi:hypothetical protein